MPTDFSGKWKEVKSEGVEAIVDMMALEDSVRKFVIEHKKSAEIVQTGDHLKVTASTPRGEKTIEVTVDGTEQEFEDFLRGGKIKSCPKWDGASLVMEMNFDGKIAKVVRSIKGGQMVMEMTMAGKKATSYWDKC